MEEIKMSEEELPVEYDMSFSTNARINYLLWKCNQMMEQENPLELFKCCKNILKECSVSMKEDEYNKHKEILKNVESSLNEYHTYCNNYYNLAQNKAGLFHPPRKCFDLLYDWETVLRKKLDKMGLLFKKGDDAYSAMI